MRDAPPAGRGSFPVVKCTEERIWILVAQQVGRFAEGDRTLTQVVVRQFATCFIEHLLKGDATFGESSLQRA